mmetsp:Transcript_8523/g.25727  ORF Transcript_8523/g.25727 Transcript_8523/m.25727 type:complete len:214 (+) Transcript_8523:162-803(+)
MRTPPRLFPCGSGCHRCFPRLRRPRHWRSCRRRRNCAASWHSLRPRSRHVAPTAPPRRPRRRCRRWQPAALPGRKPARSTSCTPAGSCWRSRRPWRTSRRRSTTSRATGPPPARPRRPWHPGRSYSSPLPFEIGPPSLRLCPWDPPFPCPRLRRWRQRAARPPTPPQKRELRPRPSLHLLPIPPRAAPPRRKTSRRCRTPARRGGSGAASERP